jgi:hypothetical protein
MKKAISFPSINRFPQFYASMLNKYNFIGLDANGEPQYDVNKHKDTLFASGTCKLHGTLGGISYNDVDGLWVQSKEQIITPNSDNAGFAAFVMSRFDDMMVLFNKIKSDNSINTSVDTISIFGEFCGKSIQKGMGINNFDKSFFIFGVKISSGTEEANYLVSPTDLRSPEKRIFNIFDYKQFQIEIDLNDPSAAIEQINKWTIEVEDCCPVAEAFGFPNTLGEGIVWVVTNPNDNLRTYMKSKGEKHAKANKERKDRVVDTDRVAFLTNLADEVCPTWRLEQMFDLEFDVLNGGKADIKRLGSFIQRLIQDVIKEELLTLSENGVEPKEINKYISNLARGYYFTREQEALGNIQIK